MHIDRYSTAMVKQEWHYDPEVDRYRINGRFNHPYDDVCLDCIYARVQCSDWFLGAQSFHNHAQCSRGKTWLYRLLRRCQSQSRNR